MKTHHARRGAIVGILMLIAGLCVAADTPVNPKTIPMASEYDLDSTSYIYCYTLGRDGHVRGDWNLGEGFIKTSGSSTTTVSNTTSGAALTGIVAGDELMIMVSGAPVRRYVTAVASVDSMTANAAWDLTNGTAFYIRHRTCSTAATAGWFRVAELAAFSVEFKIAQMDAASIDFDIECRADDASAVAQTIWTKNYTATGGDTVKVGVYNGSVGDECRAGMKITTDDGVDTTTHAEKISISVMTR